MGVKGVPGIDTMLGCNSMRFELRTSSNTSKILVIARSSGEAPKTWFVGTPTIATAYPYLLCSITQVMLRLFDEEAIDMGQDSCFPVAL